MIRRYFYLIWTYFFCQYVSKKKTGIGHKLFTFSNAAIFLGCVFSFKAYSKHNTDNNDRGWYILKIRNILSLFEEHLNQKPIIKELVSYSL